MSGSGTGDWETTDWTNFQSLLASTNVLSPTDSSDDGADRPLWVPSNGVETVALPGGAGQTAGGSEGSESGTTRAPSRALDGGDWRADASERSASGEQSSPAGDSFTSEGLAGASAGAGSVSGVTIAKGAVVVIDGPSAQSVTFAGTTGALRLEDPQAFTGVISGLTGADAIDFSRLAYGANVKATYSGDATGGTLTVTDGTKTARMALYGNYLSSTWTLSDDGKGGTSVVDPTLPPGVTLQQIDGGPTYCASNGFTYAAKAGWDNPSFFPIGPWEDSLLQQSDATRWLDLGWNTAFQITSGSNLSIADANKIWVIQTVQNGPVISGTGAETVGLLSYDEPTSFAEGVSTPLGTTPNSVQDGRFWWLNDTWNTIQYGALPGTPAPDTAATDLTYLVTTSNGTKSHIDSFSIDQYWFSGARVSGVLYAGGLLDNLGQDMTVDQAARGSNYGDIISDERAITGGSIPIFGFVEDGGPYTNDTSASDYITPPELNWAVWSELIHGARGVIYFNHTFGGPAQSDDNLAQPYYQTVQPGQTVSMYTQVKNTDALVEQMAPVFNSPTALNYVTVNTPGYENGVVDSLFSGIEVLAKDDNGQFYIFADTRDSETQTNNSATFTLADKNATSVTVIGENRTIAVTNGVFTDRFATGATVHIYEVNDGAPPPPPPAGILTSITESPSSGDLNVGKTVTLTLGFSSAVTVAGGAPTLLLNDGGSAKYTGGSGTSALTFNYTVATGQNTPDLMVTAVNLPTGVTITSGGNAANLSLTGLTQSGPQIDTTGSGGGGNLVTNGNFVTDSFSGWTLGGNSTSTTYGPEIFIDTNAEGGSTYAAGMGSVGSDGTLSQTIATTAGKSYTLSFCLQNEASGANDFRAIWNGQTLLSLTNTAQSGYTQYTYNVTATGTTSTLEFSARNDPSQWDLDNISLTANATAPAITGISDSPAKGDLKAGKTVALTLTFSEAVIVAGGSPTLLLNDGGSAKYTGGSGTSALTFNYTVATGQNTPDLMVTAVNLPTGVTITSGGNAANLSLTGLTQSGPQIDTTGSGGGRKSVTSVIASPGTGTQFPGDPITITVKMSEAVTIAGGAPTLLLNDGGSAKYTGGSGTNTLTFKYTVGSSDRDVSALAISAVSLPAGAKIVDGAGNVASMAAAIALFHGPAIDPPIVATQSKAVNADGSYDVAHFDVTGLSYTSYEDLYNSAGTPVAEARDLIGGAGTLILDANHLSVSSSSGSLGVTTGSDTFKATPHTSESIVASGRTGESFEYGSGFGHQSITGLLVSGPSNDIIQLPLTMFKGLSSTNIATQNWDALMANGAVVQSAANVTITDTAHDTLTLNNMTTSILTNHASNVFKFV